MSSLLGISKLLKRNHGHRFCIAIRSDVSGLDGAAEARVGSILQMLDVSGLDGASEHAK